MAIELDHLILRVNDRIRTLDFYTRILGFSYEGDREPCALLRVSPGFVLQVAAWGTTGGEHYAFAMPKAEFEGAFARIRDAAIAYGDSYATVGNMKGPGRESASRGVGDAVYFFDPDLHLIEIRHYELP